MYKMEIVDGDIQPLFIQLDQLRQDNDVYTGWEEKARWIRFEEQAETVLGRWSKPHVSTLLQLSIDQLNSLMSDGIILLDVLLKDSKQIADIFANQLLEYFNDLDDAALFAELLCLPHLHHFNEKQKTSSSNLNRLPSSHNMHDPSKFFL
jgi:hypothetical protein